MNIQQQIEKNRAGFRKHQGTFLKNARTKEVVYTPPQHASEIASLMSNLVDYINTDELCDADPLVKMAIVHHQFESIHSFYDGNGRTGYDHGFMEAQNYEELSASAMKIAQDAKFIALPDTLFFINQQLFADEHRVDTLILDISRSEQITYEDAENLLNIMKQQF